MVIDENKNLVENPEGECACQFIVGEDGQPTVLCSDAESQERAVRAMEEHGDVLVRVTPVLIESDPEGEVDQAGANLDQADADLDEDEEPEELEVGSVDLDDDGDTDEEDEVD